MVGRDNTHLVGFGVDDVLVAVTGTTVEDGQSRWRAVTDAHLGNIGPLRQALEASKESLRHWCQRNR